MRFALPGHGWGLSETHNETSQKHQVCAASSIRPGTVCPVYHDTRGFGRLGPKCGQRCPKPRAVHHRKLVRHSDCVELWALKICFARHPIGSPNASLLPTTAKTCCVPGCDVAPVGHHRERQCDIRCPPVLLRLVRLSAQPTCVVPPQLSGLSSSHHQKVLLKRRKLLVDLMHHGRFPTGQRLPSRAALSEFALAAYPPYRYR